jgi:DNA mismatch repair ATPase MutS
VGINAVLAMAGGPSCARSLTMPAVEVRCCMRVEDSVVAGVSFFMAELQRLKGVLDAALEASDRPVLYLLDEIMQGTNTLERQIASRAVLAQLTGTKAIGAISSHDLGLLVDSRLDDSSVKAHFAEQFRNGRTGPEMTFDYKLQPGIATSTNALKLMAILGFDVPADTSVAIVD